MKNQPSKLLLALAVCLTMTAAYADNGNNGNNGNNDNSNKNQHSNKDTSGRSVTVAAADSCSANVVATACGPVQVTTCSTNGSTTSTAVSNAQKNKDSERHKDDGKDRGDGKDHSESNHGDNSKYAASNVDGDDTIGKPYGYHWEQTNAGGVKQRKVTICHREGGTRTSIDVDDDGRYHGHDQDPMDTEGACEDQDDRTGKHTDSRNSGRAVVPIHKATVCGVARAYQYKGNDGKHHTERDHNTDANDSTSRYRTRNTANDDASGYRWVHDKDGSNSTTGDRQNKIIICHRMGNARVTLDVDDDGYAHGHHKHPNDTVGRCEDQDDNTHRYTAGNLNGQKPASLATETACAPSTTTTTTTTAACTNAGGVTTVLGGLGCGTAGVSCAPLSTGTRPIRGGLRNVR